MCLAPLVYLARRGQAAAGFLSRYGRSDVTAQPEAEIVAKDHVVQFYDVETDVIQHVSEYLLAACAPATLLSLSQPSDTAAASKPASLPRASTWPRRVGRAGT